MESGKSFIMRTTAVEMAQQGVSPRCTPASAPCLTPRARKLARDNILKKCPLLIDDVWLNVILLFLDAPDWVNLTVAFCTRPEPRLRRLALSARLATTYPQFTPRWDLVCMFHNDIHKAIQQESLEESVDEKDCDDLLYNHQQEEEEEDAAQLELNLALVHSVVSPSGKIFSLRDETTFTDASLRELVPCTWPRTAFPLPVSEDRARIVDEKTDMWNAIYKCLWNAMPLGMLTPNMDEAVDFFDGVMSTSRMTPLRAFECPSVTHNPGTCPWPSRDLSHSVFFATTVQMVARILACDEDVFGDWEAWVRRWFLGPLVSFSPSNTKLLSSHLAMPFGATGMSVVEEHVEHARELTLRLAYHLSFFDDRGRWKLEESPLQINWTCSAWQRALGKWLDADACYRCIQESPYVLQQWLTSPDMTEDSGALTAYMTPSYETSFGATNVATFQDVHHRTAFGSRRFCGAGLCHATLRIPLIANHRTLGGEHSSMLPHTGSFDSKFYDARKVPIRSKRKSVYTLHVRGRHTPCGSLLAECYEGKGEARFYSLDGEIDTIDDVLSLPHAKRRCLTEDGQYV